MSSSIFNDIWQADDNRVTPTYSLNPDSFNSSETLPDTVVLIDKRQGTIPDADYLFNLYELNDGRYEKLQDPRNLFTKRETFKLVNDLFDNYVIDQHRMENPMNEEEIDNFLDGIINTRCVQVATSYLGKSQDEMKDYLKDIWFSQVSVGRNRDLSAFEHCFVGEMNVNKVSGYHFWFKYLIDDSIYNFNGVDNIQRVKHLNNANEHPPSFVQLSFEQKVERDETRIAQAKLIAKFKSFLVGASPECFIALATIAYNMYKDNPHTKPTIELNGSEYHLVIQVLGTNYPHFHEYLRSFYPVP